MKISLNELHYVSHQCPQIVDLSEISSSIERERIRKVLAHGCKDDAR